MTAAFRSAVRPSTFLRRAGSLAVLLLASLCFAPSQPPLAGQSAGPDLVVLLVFDQFRADYVQRFGGQWSGGLKRLFSEGAVFRQAAYPYFNTVTCASHASIVTGATPANHGIVLNAWWDRDLQRLVSCEDDPDSPVVSLGNPIAGGASASHLLLPTLSDEMRVQLGAPPLVVSLAQKPRSAVMLAGRRADVAMWFDAEAGWVTSEAYGTAVHPAAAAFVRRHPVSQDHDRVWTPLLSPDRLLYAQNLTGRTPENALGPDFPHRVGGENGRIDESFFLAWEDTPLADEYLQRLASTLIADLRLGQRGVTDYLGVSFGGLDRVGHTFGPFSHEVQDALARLDVSVGTLLADLDRLVGAGRYVAAVTSDHGAAPIPEQMVPLGFDAGRLSTRRLRTAVDERLATIWGEGRYVANMQHSQLYFRDGVFDRLAADDEAMDAVRLLLEATPGVARVYRNDRLALGGSGDDPIGQAVAGSLFAGRSGDLSVIPRPYWITSTEATSHGTGYGYDTSVPVVLFGHGIRPGVYLEPASPLDVAPTLAHLAGVTLARPDGKVLYRALQPAPRGERLPGVTSPQ